jgi:hypothetical protein
MSTDLILPSEIPWGEIKGSNLEELLYWLFDSMGAKDLEWRIAGKGTGASDQGRDLERRLMAPLQNKLGGWKRRAEPVPSRPMRYMGLL